MDFKDHQAIYLQIADLFCERILLQEWKPEDRIPSVREMAVNLEVNPNTVMRTYNYLQDKGIIYNRRGIGYFVALSGYDKTRELKKEDFIHEDLPALFRTMELLEIDLEDLKHFFKNYLNSRETGQRDENK